MMVSSPTFWTSRLVFKGVDEKDDVAAIELLYSDPVTQMYAMGTSLPVTTQFAEKHIKGTMGGLLCGFMGMGSGDPSLAHHGRANFAIAMRPEFAGKGYGPEALEWLLEQAFVRFRLHSVRGGTWAFNAPARKAYAKVGFSEEGVLKEKWWINGAWVDEICLCILDSTWRERQAQKAGTSC
ncbi:hypothetical protein RQP46_001302 [Phenoliferia psychrophenolica]